MWSIKKSILLSKLCILCFVGVIICLVIFCRPLLWWMFQSSITDLEWLRLLFPCTFYTGAIPALLLLWDLYKILCRINQKEIFVEENVKALRRISWYCFLGGFISLASCVYYLPFLVVAFPAVFVGLIVRVIKNVFDQAVLLQEEVNSVI